MMNIKMMNIKMFYTTKATMTNMVYIMVRKGLTWYSLESQFDFPIPEVR